MSRVDSSRIAVWKANEAGLSLKGSAVCKRRRFFPFPTASSLRLKPEPRRRSSPADRSRTPKSSRRQTSNRVAMVFTGTRHFRALGDVQFPVFSFQLAVDCRAPCVLLNTEPLKTEYSFENPWPASPAVPRLSRSTGFAGLDESSPPGQIGSRAGGGASLKSGFDVVCFRGEAASFSRARWRGCAHVYHERSRSLKGCNPWSALPMSSSTRRPSGDFVLEKIDCRTASVKVQQPLGLICLTLKPAKKVLPEMRAGFRRLASSAGNTNSTAPASRRSPVPLRRFRRPARMPASSTVAPTGRGFGLLLPDRSHAHFPDKAALASHLAGCSTDQPKRPATASSRSAPDRGSQRFFANSGVSKSQSRRGRRRRSCPSNVSPAACCG